MSVASIRINLGRRSLAFLEVKATGFDPNHDRIIEIAAVIRAQGKPPRTYQTRVFPCVPILPAATRAHGLTDADVASAPLFDDIAHRLVRFLGAADLAGYDIRQFALPMLWAEFRRCQVDFHCFQRSVIDIQDLYHRFEPRDLATAIQKYLGRSFNPHADALAVTQACSDLLNAQLAIHPELPESVAGLAAYPQRVDPQGFFHVGDGRHLFASGRYRGRTVDEVAELNPHYLRSLLGNSLEWTARFAIEKALQRVTDSPKPSVDLLRTGEPGNSPDPTSD